MKRITPKQVAQAVPIERALRSSVVDKRKANNAHTKKRGTGFKAGVSDNDPMQKDSESNYP